MISPNSTHENTYYNNVEPPFDNFGTTHVSVMDQNGLVVSATSTINQLWAEKSFTDTLKGITFLCLEILCPLTPSAGLEEPFTLREQELS